MSDETSNPTQTEDWVMVKRSWLAANHIVPPDLASLSPRGRGEGLEWLERIHNALMTPSMPRQSIGEMAAAGIAALSSAPVSGGGESTLLDDLAAAQGEIAAAIERIRELSLDYQREYDGRQAAQARADRMEGALREVANLGEIVAKSYVDEHKPDTLRDPKTGEEVTGLIAETVVALIQTVIALGDRARSALTLKSEKEGAE